ncbi:hypothetical protein WA171_003358, partial [Blastocystis sp. BT1]
MNSSQISVLLDALVHFLLATTVYCILLCLLFYAVFKTVISMEDENENQKWLKFWVFYGLLSCICSYCPHGSFIKACTCGILLLKFNNNIILHFVYDVILSNLLKYSYGYMIVVFHSFVYFLFLIISKLHWVIISTLNMTDDMAEESLNMYSSCRDVVMKCEKRWWKKEGEDLSNRLLSHQSKETPSQLSNTIPPKLSGWVSQSVDEGSLSGNMNDIYQPRENTNDEDLGLRKRR